MQKRRIPWKLLLTLAAAILFLPFVLVATQRALSNLELVLLQAAATAVGVYASFASGRASVEATTNEFMRGRARTAIRRLILIYSGIGRIAGEIEHQRQMNHSGAETDGESGALTAALDVIAARVSEQLATADNAIDEWRDLAPSDVEELEERARRARSDG